MTTELTRLCHVCQTEKPLILFNLKSHLESQFKPGMSWIKRHEWHIDHIVPLASAKTEGELIKLNHYSNLQPLWAIDNLRKSNR